MALLQRNARSLLLLRLIGKNKDVQTSELRALSHLLRPHDGCNAAQFPLRPYCAVSGSLASPLSNFTQAGDVHLTDSTYRGCGFGNGRHSAFCQTASFTTSAVCQDVKHNSSKEGAFLPKTAGQAFHDAGWTRQEVINIPNALSMGRLLSGPVVAHMILQHHWPAAMVTLAIAGISDWADGYAAKHWGQSSVLGSYLDPLADKVLIGCTVGALAAEGSLPVALAAIIIGRDVLLVTGACVDRCRRIGWRKVGWAEFFRTAPSLPGAAPRMPGSAPEAQGPQSQSQRSDVSNAAPGAEQPQQQTAQGGESASQREDEPADGSEGVSTASSAHSTSRDDDVVPPAEFVQPLYISKLNTVFQLALIGGCITHSWYGWPSEELLWGLGGVTALATLASFAAYVQVYRKGAMRTEI